MSEIPAEPERWGLFVSNSPKALERLPQQRQKPEGCRWPIWLPETNADVVAWSIITGFALSVLTLGAAWVSAWYF